MCIHNAGIILVYDVTHLVYVCVYIMQGIILVYDITHLVYVCVYIMQGIILVYDITNQKSFDNIQKWLNNIEMVC